MKNFEELYEYIGNLCYSLFPKATSYEHILKLKQEADEILIDLNNPEEYADVFFALIGAAYKAGIEPKQFLNEAYKKAKINKNRIWIEMPDGTHQHKK